MKSITPNRPQPTASETGETSGKTKQFVREATPRIAPGRRTSERIDLALVEQDIDQLKDDRGGVRKFIGSIFSYVADVDVQNLFLIWLR